MLAQLYTNSGTLVATIDNNKIEIHSDDFKRELTVNGVTIPHYLSAQFDKRQVPLKDPDFVRVFTAVYSARARSMGFVWKEYKQTNERS